MTKKAPKDFKGRNIAKAIAELIAFKCHRPFQCNLV